MPYEVKRYQRDPKTLLAPAELRHVHPLGKSPVIEDQVGDASEVVAETGAIVEYLVRRAGGAFGEPEMTGDALLYRHFLHYAEGSLMPVLFTRLVLRRVPLLGRLAARKFQTMIDVHVDYVETQLSRRAWFAGAKFTAADVMMSYPLEVARRRAGISSSSHPQIFDWLERIHARPAFAAALKRGGAYTVI